jgi:hypothetical protein
MISRFSTGNEDHVATAENLTCPFCGEDGFDKIGLKGHLLEFCEVFPELETPFEEMLRHRRDKKS